MNDVHLILVSGPTTVMRIYNTKGYQEATAFYSKYAKEKGCNLTGTEDMQVERLNVIWEVE